MSGRRPNEQAIEIWIAAYLKKLSKTFNRRAEAKFIEKAIMRINLVFGHPCCDDPENFVNLITPNENTLTHTVRQLLQRDKLIRRDYRLSLFRILNNLNNVLYGQCCDAPVTVNFTGGALPANVLVTFTDLVTGAFITSTLTTGTDTQSALVPAKYFGGAALISVQMTIINAPGSTNTFQLTDATGLVYANGAVPGVIASHIFKPLQSVYTINII
jgi:hypothetical protein